MPESVDITLSATEFVYNGKAQKPKVKVITKGDDPYEVGDYAYKVTYKNNKNAWNRYGDNRGSSFCVLRKGDLIFQNSPERFPVNKYDHHENSRHCKEIPEY